MNRRILFNVPNIICYVRILLVFTGCLFFNHNVFITFIVISALLDIADGYFARKLNQETRFGEWLDVVVDLFTRGLLWSRTLPNFGFLVFGFEFLVFVAIHSNAGEGVKSWQERKRGLNWFTAQTVSKGFKTIPGAIAIIGLWVLPIWMYIMTSGNENSVLVDNFNFSPDAASSLEFLITAFLITSRIHCLHVELAILRNHILNLLEN